MNINHRQFKIIFLVVSLVLVAPKVTNSFGMEQKCLSLIQEYATDYSVTFNNPDDLNKIDNRERLIIRNTANNDKQRLEALELDFIAKKIKKPDFENEKNKILFNGAVSNYPEIRPEGVDEFVDNNFKSLKATHQVVFGGVTKVGNDRVSMDPLTEKNCLLRGNNFRLLFDDKNNRLVGIVIVERAKNQISVLPVNEDCSEDSSSFRTLPLLNTNFFERQKDVAQLLHATRTEMPPKSNDQNTGVQNKVNIKKLRELKRQKIRPLTQPIIGDSLKEGNKQG